MLPSFLAPHRAPRSSGAAAQVEVCQTAAGIIQVKGEGRAECAGALLRGLLAARRLAVVTLDLSELRSISGLALGVLGAYLRCVARAGGRAVLAGMLNPAVQDPLVRATLFDLFQASTDAGPAPDIQAINQPRAAPTSPRGPSSISGNSRATGTEGETTGANRKTGQGPARTDVLAFGAGIDPPCLGRPGRSPHVPVSRGRQEDN